MFAPTPRSSASSKRAKPYSRSQKNMTRSNSILGTIKNIVSAPLSWFASSDENFEDLGKRRRQAAKDIADIEEGQPQRREKRRRVDSPERPPERVQPPTAGYLDPPPTTSLVTQQATRDREQADAHTRRSSAIELPSSSSIRLMSVDPPHHYATLNRDPAMVPLPGSPTRSSPRRSVGPEDIAHVPRTPSRLRTSYTPQVALTKPLRREASAPPPLSSLQSRPMFVKPPSDEGQREHLDSKEVLPLGTLAEFSRGSRAPSQDRILNGVGSNSRNARQITSSASSDAVLQPTKSLSEKVFRELEIYKTPILPSRYKDANAIPSFLQPKRSHVPIPMSKKGKASKPSLGMGVKEDREKTGSSSRDDGKPYARRDGYKKLIAKRKVDGEDANRGGKIELPSVEEEDEMDTDIEPSKRDVGVSTRMTSGSEDERSRLRKVNARLSDADVPQGAQNDPFSRQPASVLGGRHQPYGRVGRTRARDPGQRSVPLGRPTNKFSAFFDDDEGSDSAEKSTTTNEFASGEKAQVTAEAAKSSVYEAPKGFSFEKDVPSINLDHAWAKEPPIPSLPFSLGQKPAAPPTNAGDKTKETSSLKPSLSALPLPQPSPENAEEKKENSAAAAPNVGVIPPTPDQSVKEVKETPAVPNFFAAPSSTAGASDAAASNATPKSTGIPNFFANSVYVAGSKPSSPAPKPAVPTSFPAAPAATPATPVKDPENPLWNGNDAAPGAPPKLFAGVNKPFTFGTKSMEATNTSSAPAVSASLFGQPPKSSSAAESVNGQQLGSAQIGMAASAPASTPSTSVAATTSEAAPVPSKPSDSENKPAGSGPTPFFSFGTSSTSNVPKPLFGTGGTTASSAPFSTQPSQPAQNATANTAQKPAFSFGVPQPASGADKPSDTQSSQAARTLAGTGGQKLSFSFGAPSAGASAPPPSNNVNIAAPKPLFGSEAAGTGFTFGTPAPSAAPGGDAAKPASPFAFGAPPATPPAGERQGSPFTFGAAPSTGTSTGFTFGTPAKPNGTETSTAPSIQAPTSPFTFGAQSARPVTPPPKPDEGMSMEESPTHMDMNGAGQKRPIDSISFGSGPTPVNPFGQNTNAGFTFGSTSASSSPFAQKDENKLSVPNSTGGFNFNRTSSAPAISTSFSFDAKADQSTAPATAFGTPPNPFGQPQTSGTSSSPFNFGQPQQSAPAANPFGSPAQPSAAPGSTPSSPFATNTPAFTFGAPSNANANAPSNSFVFGSSAPSSPANGATGLPQTSGGAPSFTFGQPAGSSGSTLFNIGAAPPSTTTPGRQMKKLPRRGPPPKR
ncbi:uncharacterized protein FOMMEDRAFT_141279 [Fomitiporia mediterranea MF3/22]|uniref:uncharacterized protein n=1 Tax=Fomitiporia mediterranea (strain MF3/22) TaxID=694068 RepID=UPI000440741E|nr:uncharacterized protein FOMMEDRAFT_141279 [Fomitiporia mediterranea MF3/22]EJD02118.1 hypothetical protein FOMMEDRAFT_141279 [Fomitiporia mediterranea MF3/22]